MARAIAGERMQAILVGASGVTMIQRCESPQITRVLRSLDSRDDSLFIVGVCFHEGVTVTFGELGVQKEIIDSGLIRIEELPPLQRGLKPVIQVESSVTYFGSSTNPVPDSATYELEHTNRIYQLLVDSDSQIVLGDTPKYFGLELEPVGTESTIALPISEYDASDYAEEAYIIIEAAGIGPGSSNLLTESGVFVNDRFYSFENYWPYWESTGRTFSKAKAMFLIPISASDLKEGENVLKFVAYQYKNDDGSIGIDNYVVTRIGLGVSTSE